MKKVLDRSGYYLHILTGAEYEIEKGKNLLSAITPNDMEFTEQIYHQVGSCANNETLADMLAECQQIVADYYQFRQTNK